MLEIPSKNTGIAIIETGCENVNQIQNDPANQDNTGRQQSSLGKWSRDIIYTTPRINVATHQKPI
jgi:hypothetical protein